MTTTKGTKGTKGAEAVKYPVTPGAAVVRPGTSANDAPDPDVVEFNLDHLTIDEIEQMEDLTGEPFDEIWKDGKRKGKTMRAFATIIQRRTDPDFTWEAAGRLKIKFDSTRVPPTVDGG